MVHIYCDGSVKPNPGIGGWGFAAYDDDGTEIHFESGSLAVATNNTAEMTALLHALLWAGQWPARIFSDSQYTVNGINDWCHGWSRKGWMRKDGGVLKPIPNVDIWKELVKARLPIHTICWVRGHAGTRGNERADELAGAARVAHEKNGVHYAA